MENTTKSEQQPCRTDKRFWGGCVLRAEMFLLFVGFVCTVCGKGIIIHRQNLSNEFLQTAYAAVPDIFFFASVVLLINFLYLLKPSAFMARAALLIVGLIAVWSLLGFGWLIKSGVQLQPKIIAILVRDFAELWPIVQSRITMSFTNAILMGMFVCAFGSFFIWKFIKPADAACGCHVRRVRITSAAIIILALLKSIVPPPDTNVGYTGEMLGFSSHWRALVCCVADSRKNPNLQILTRNIVQSGQRKMISPKIAAGDLPNVVLVILESVPYSQTSLADPDIERMPYLTQLASEGIEFQSTHVPVSPIRQRLYGRC